VPDSALVEEDSTKAGVESLQESSTSSAPPARFNINSMVKTPWGKASATFLSSLHDLRRKPMEEDKDSQLFRQTVGDVHDTSEMLRARKNTLEEAIAATLQTGGERHPTVIISRRCLLVVERKLAIIEDLEAKCNAFEAIHGRGEELWEKIFSGELKGDDVVGDAADFRAVVRDAAHIGDPLEADKSDFAFFVSSLGLPPSHDLLLRSQKALRKGVQASCRCALDVFAKRAAGLPDSETKALSINTAEAVSLLMRLSTQSKHNVLRQLKAESSKLRARYVLSKAKEASTLIQNATTDDGPMLLTRAANVRSIIMDAVAFGVPDEAGEIKQAKLIVLGLRARTVLQNARRLQANEKERPDNRTAVMSAARIRAECSEALEFGVLANDSDLAAARLIAASLHAMKVVRVALHEKDEDARAVEKNVYIAGDATAAAERIDGEIKEALRAFVPRDHPLLEDARGIAKHLREQEFFRKRMIASNARRHN